MRGAGSKNAWALFLLILENRMTQTIIMKSRIRRVFLALGVVSFIERR